MELWLRDGILAKAGGLIQPFPTRTARPLPGLIGRQRIRWQLPRRLHRPGSMAPTTCPWCRDPVMLNLLRVTTASCYAPALPWTGRSRHSRGTARRWRSDRITAHDASALCSFRVQPFTPLPEESGDHVSSFGSPES